jgi:hypothetical protein
MMMTTGWILERRVVEAAVFAMTTTMTLARLRRTRRVVTNGPGKEREQRTGRGKGRGRGRETVKGKVLLNKPQGGDDISRAIALQLQKERYETDSDMEG